MLDSRLPFASAVRAILALTLLSSAATEVAAQPGVWSQPWNWNNTAVHMALLPGDGHPYHSRIVWWVDEDVPNQTFAGGQWGWRAPSGVDTSYSSTTFDALGIPAPGVNIFCSAPIQLPDGRLLTVGGTEDWSENGVRSAAIFRPDTGAGQGSWAIADSMNDRRWYPSATLLPDGRVLGSSGSKFPEIDIFGGNTNGTTTPRTDKLGRFGMVATGHWDESIRGNPWNVYPSLGGTFCTAGAWGCNMFYGGRDTTGKITDQSVHFIYPHNVASLRSPDYDAKATSPNVVSTTNPRPRAYHASVTPGDSMMIVFGGIAGLASGSEAPSSEVWLFRMTNSVTYDWSWKPISASGGPGARFGHKAIWDPDRKRMIVFGGIGALSDIANGASDTRVWSLQFPSDTSTTATWDTLTVDIPATRPDPRWDHSFEYSSIAQTDTVSGTVYSGVKSAVLFGGRDKGSKRFNDVWRLLLLPNEHVRWMPYSSVIPGTPPSARSAHSGTFESESQRLYVFGGMTASGVTDDAMYCADLSNSEHLPPWQAYANWDSTRAWHAAVLDYPIFNRLPEIFTPSASPGTQWSHASGVGTTLLQAWYPQSFVVPGGKVFVAGPCVLQGDSTYEFDPANNSWWALPSSGDSVLSGFIGGSAVMYRPGKVMKCCTRDTEVGQTAVSTTKTIDPTSASPGWHSSHSLWFDRVNMNLTLLPTGMVIVTGGTGFADNNHYVNPRQIPEIWDPATGVWSGGSGAGQLAASSIRRGYHSTAILLPDGRILCAGGNVAADLANIETDRNYGDIYSPPYLFNSNGTLATRPTTTSAPIAHVNWNRTFTVCTSSPTTVKSMCLIKPGATTHAFDQDQRYVPLSFIRATNPSRLLVTAPLDSTYAPPGDYLMFIVDSSAVLTGVPSVATWLKLDRLRGRDSADVTSPGAIADLAGCADSPNTAELSWSVPWDDGSVSGSGQPVEYEIKRSGSHITDTNWTNATPVHPTPAEPITPATVDGMTVDQLLVHHTYYFRMKTMDDNGNWSGLSNEVSVFTPYQYSDCGGMFAGGGGGGGGSSARPASVLSGAVDSPLGSVAENSVLDALTGISEGTDVLRLPGSPISPSGSYQVRLRTAGSRRFALDRARLLVCDHDPSVSAYWTGNGITAGTRSAAKRATASDGTDVGAELSSGATYSAKSGTTIDLDPGAGSEGPFTLILEVASGTIGGLADSTGVLIESQDKSGAWQVAAHVHPRRDASESAIPGLSGGLVRLQFLTDQSVSFVGTLSPSATPMQVQTVNVGAAMSRGAPDPKSALAGTDSLITLMAGADTLALSFSALPAVDGQSRDYFLALDASLSTVSVAPALRSQSVGNALPVAFALEQNRPNPFSGTTAIRFALPVGEMVRLDLFDAQGRRVRTLASHYFPPGVHSIEWDHAMENGRAAGPGVYFYRIEAGPFRDRKKMVLLGN